MVCALTTPEVVALSGILVVRPLAGWLVRAVGPVLALVWVRSPPGLCLVLLVLSVCAVGPCSCLFLGLCARCLCVVCVSVRVCMCMCVSVAFGPRFFL